jgi:hypothetical protein
MPTRGKGRVPQIRYALSQTDRATRARPWCRRKSVPYHEPSKDA